MQRRNYTANRKCAPIIDGGTTPNDIGSEMIVFIFPCKAGDKAVGKADIMMAPGQGLVSTSWLQLSAICCH
jgi:hypothetical protein